MPPVRTPRAARGSPPRPAPLILARRGVLLVVAAAAATGVLAGLARLGVLVGWGPRHALDHGALLVVGVFGTVIALERAVALGRAWAYAAPALGAACAVALLGGLPGATWLGVGGAAVALAIDAAIVRRQVAAFTYLMLLGGAVRLAGTLGWAEGLPAGDVAWAWSAAFVLTIVAERLEMSRLAPTPRWAGHALAGVAIALALGALLRMRGVPGATPVAGAALALTGAWQLRFDLAHWTVRRGGLPRFVAVGVLLGAAWLVVAGALILVGPAPVTGTHVDAALHAIFVGYVLSMVMAHAPIILPAVARVTVRYTPLAFAPLALLHAGLALRIAGALAGDVALRQAGASGTGLALVAYVVVLVTARRARGARR